MDALRIWLALGGGALLVVAIGVAWWEHLRRASARRREREAAERARRARVVGDLDAELHAVGAALDAQEHARTSERDLQTRRAALEVTLQRMARHDPAAADDPPGAWPETEPMVLATGVPPRVERLTR